MEANILVNAVKANGLHEILHQSLESGHCPSPVAGVGDVCVFCANCLWGTYAQ